MEEIQQLTKQIQQLVDEHNKAVEEYTTQKNAKKGYAHLREPIQKLKEQIDELKAKRSELQLKFNPNVNVDNNLNENPLSDVRKESDTEEEEDPNMAQTDSEVLKLVRDNFPLKFSGEDGTVNGAIGAINILKRVIKDTANSSTNQELAVEVIKTKCVGLAHSIANPCNSFNELQKAFSETFKGEDKFSLITKINTLKKSEDFTSKMDDLAKKLVSAYVADKYTIKQAEELTTQCVLNAVKDKTGTNPANVNKFVGVKFENFSEVLNVFTALENEKAKTTVMQIRNNGGRINSNRGNYRGSNRGNHTGGQGGSQVCYNCNRRGHISRNCRAPRTQQNQYQQQGSQQRGGQSQRGQHRYRQYAVTEGESANVEPNTNTRQGN